MTVQPDWQRRRIVMGIGAATTMAVAGCAGGEDETATPTETTTPTATQTRTPTTTQEPTETPGLSAQVRVAHLSPNAPAVDVYVDGNEVLGNVPFGAVSQYLSVPAGSRQIKITPAGNPDTAVFDDALEVAAETAYTVAATGEIGDEADRPFAPTVLQDDRSAPSSDMSRLRLVHTSPDAPAVDVTLADSGDVLFDDVEFGASDAVDVPSGSYTVQVRGATDANDGDVVASFDVTLEGGTAYTAFAAGYLTPDDEPDTNTFGLAVTSDSDDQGGATFLEPNPMAKQAMLRVAHLSPNAPNVDIYLDGAAVLEDVPFKTVSSYLDVEPGEHSVRITPAGNPDTAVFDNTITVSGGRAYTIAATGEIGDQSDRPFTPRILRDDRKAPDSDKSRLRLNHFAPDAPAVDVTLASNGDVLYDAVDFGAGGSITVPAGEYTIQVRENTGTDEGPIVASFDLTLEGGTAYSAFAAGYLTSDDDPGDSGFGLVVTADSDDEGGATFIGPNPSVRVAHLSPNAPNVDIYLDGTTVLEDVPFGAVSQYLTVSPGSRRVKITPAGDPNTAVFDDEIDVSTGTAYTITATGEVGGQADRPFTPTVLQDSRSAPDSETARLRLVHTAPDAPAVDVTLASNGNTLFDGLEFGNSGSVDVPAGSYTVDVRGDTETNDGDVVASFDLSLDGGTAYTAFAGGYLSPDDEPGDKSFELTVAVDSTDSGERPKSLRIRNESVLAALSQSRAGPTTIHTGVSSE